MCVLTEKTHNSIANKTNTAT